jgi:hypothetical protein
VARGLDQRAELATNSFAVVHQMHERIAFHWPLRVPSNLAVAHGDLNTSRKPSPCARSEGCGVRDTE